MGRKHTAGTAGNQGVGGVQVDNTTLSAAADQDITIDPSGTGIFKIAGDAQLQAQGDLRFADSDSSNYVAFQAPATVTSNVTWTLPATDGTNTQVLSTNGTGTLNWATPGITVTDNTTDSATHYVAITTASSGSITGARVSSTKLSFQPSTGTMGLLGNTASSSTTTGTLVVTGGVGVSGAFYAGGTARFTDATASSSASTGAVTVAGGLGVGGQGRFTGDVFASGNATGLQAQISAKLDATASPGAILYQCHGCWDGSAIIPAGQRGIYSRYEIQGATNYWQYYCSQATFGFAGACGGACSPTFQAYCCVHCTCGWVGDRKCFNGTDSYECAGAIAWPFGCSSGCDTACTIQGFNFHVALTPDNLCCGSERGFHYCFTMSNNGDSNWCCIGNRNSGQGISCCGGHPACLTGVCFTTPSGSNPFACVTNVQIIGYGRIG